MKTPTPISPEELFTAHNVLAERVVEAFDAPDNAVPLDEAYRALGDYALVTDVVASTLRTEVEVTFCFGLCVAGWPESRAADITSLTYVDPLDPPLTPRLIDDIDLYGHLKPGDVGYDVTVDGHGNEARVFDVATLVHAVASQRFSAA